MACMTRTPLRVSLFGGGTDYPEYFQRRPGAVVGFAIQKYIYLTALKLEAKLGYNYRLSYSKLEFTDRVEEIDHPVVREALKLYEISDKLDINVMSDLPSSGGGLGSSSAFTVGFVNLITAMLRKPMTKMDLARTAIRIEREILGENVGVQDQLHTSFGGVNRFDFDGDRIRISPIQISGERLLELNQSLVLIHTGIARRATQVVAEQVAATSSHKIDKDLSHLYEMVGDAVGVLENGKDDMLPELGRRLVESWKIKRSLSSSISNGEIDDIYDKAMKAGAYGGKLCGAGGGGFIMMLCPPDRIANLTAAMDGLAVLPTGVDVEGTTVLRGSDRVLGR
ncbi:MAG: GHMP kinase [Maricaulis sp.]|jgi:D-glycero-alpha-D-manno-heptose-7-phosphate kinase|nr:GHMP kinase [Maricaulis sp.]HAQ35130.1 GHMP kinase [Alphaproteobacteria bacterium]